MHYLDKLLGAQPMTLALAALLLMALAIAYLVTKGGRGRGLIGVGALVSPRADTAETLSPAASKYIDERIVHKWNGTVSAPFLQVTKEVDSLRRWVKKLDGDREATNERTVRMEARLENLERGQERMEEKLDRLIERRDR